MNAFLKLAPVSMLVGCAAMSAWEKASISTVSPEGKAMFSFTTGEQRRSDGSSWKITLSETERQPRISIIVIAHEGRPNSVGGSMFTGCAVLALARERGYRYIAQKLEGKSTLKVGFLDSLEDDPAKVLGAEFAVLAANGKYDVNRFALLCDVMMKRNEPDLNGN